MKKKIYLSPPHMSGNEQDYINKAFESNWIAPLGPNVDNFEKNAERYLGGGYAVALNSGTSAIHVALIMLGVEPGDTVFCSSMTFVASANPIMYVGAEPVFIDSEKESWNICPDILEKAICEVEVKPKVLIVVDLLGQSANYKKIVAICKKYGVAIVEDAAEALGAEYDGEKCGLFGDFGIFSFNGNKILSTSGGGMLICKSKEDAERAKFLITQARDKAPYYLHTEVGYNYRMSNIIAGIGIAQLGVLDLRVRKKREINSYYKRELSSIECIEFMPEPSWSLSTKWLTSITIKLSSSIVPDDVINALECEGIEARRLWKPLHTQPLFSGYKYYSSSKSICDDLFNRGVSLPSGTQLEKSDLERIVTVIKDLFKNESK